MDKDVGEVMRQDLKTRQRFVGSVFQTIDMLHIESIPP